MQPHVHDVTGILLTAILASSAVTAAAMGVLWLAIRRRLGAGAPPDALRDIATQLARMETAIEATAIEVERIGEAQRFYAAKEVERIAAQHPATRWSDDRDTDTLPTAGAAPSGARRP